MAKGACMAKGGMCGEGGMRGERGHVWQRGECMAKGGMCGEGRHAWQRGGAWQRGEVCMVCMPLPSTRYGRSMRRRYASYWNAFLLSKCWKPCWRSHLSIYLSMY